MVIISTIILPVVWTSYLMGRYPPFFFGSSDICTIMIVCMITFALRSSNITVLYLQTHKIKKFVLHTNYPGHADFNSYIKCNFVIFGSDCKFFSVSEVSN